MTARSSALPAEAWAAASSWLSSWGGHGATGLRSARRRGQSLPQRRCGFQRRAGQAGGNAPEKALYYDADGNGAAAKVKVAIFDNGYTPTASDIVLF